MITDYEMAAAIESAAKEYARGDISAAILIRDIRAAIRIFDQQPTEYVTEAPTNFTP